MTHVKPQDNCGWRRGGTGPGKSGQEKQGEIDRMRSDEEAVRLRERAPTPSLGSIGQGQGIGRQANRRIGTHLRAMYDTVLQQPIPERFVDLIARLGDASPEPSPGEGGGGGARDPA